MSIEQILSQALSCGASDIHIQEDAYNCIRVNGDLRKLTDISTKSDLEEFCNRYIALDDNGSYKHDFSFTFEERRFRGNYYKARGRECLALRALSARIPSLDQLHLPPEIESLKKVGNGLILIIGETGSGKSTTMASFIQYFNESYPYNILTIEDPIEYVYMPGKSRITQREVGTDVASFSDGVRDAMREDPDIIVVGEMRDKETISNAITLAETGHKVFTTLHARNCIEVMDRIADVFPGDTKDVIRAQAANVIQAVVHQTLIKSDTFGRLPLLEILRIDAASRSSLADKKVGIENIRQRMRSGRKEGNLHRVDCFNWLMEKYDIDASVAENILSPDDYQLLIRG